MTHSRYFVLDSLFYFVYSSFVSGGWIRNHDFRIVLPEYFPLSPNYVVRR